MEMIYGDSQFYFFQKKTRAFHLFSYSSSYLYLRSRVTQNALQLTVFISSSFSTLFRDGLTKAFLQMFYNSLPKKCVTRIGRINIICCVLSNHVKLTVMVGLSERVWSLPLQPLKTYLITRLFDLMVLRDHVTNQTHFMPTTKVPIATKLGRMVTYFDGLLLPIKYDPLIAWSCEITHPGQGVGNRNKSNIIFTSSYFQKS